MGHAHRFTVGIRQGMLQAAVKIIIAVQFIAFAVKRLVSTVRDSDHYFSYARITLSKTGSQLTTELVITYFNTQVVLPARQMLKGIQDQGFGIGCYQAVQVQP